jgi:hypothetical protein
MARTAVTVSGVVWCGRRMILSGVLFPHFRKDFNIIFYTHFTIVGTEFYSD